MSIKGNSFTNTIPSEIGKLSKLGWIYAQQNKFSGELPEESGMMNSLVYADFSYNQLSGEIPKELGTLKDLSGLRLDGNSFVGEVNDSLCLNTSIPDAAVPHVHTIDLGWINIYSGFIDEYFQFEVNFGLFVDCEDGVPVLDCLCCICA